jgi:hypothetical protein
MPRLTLKQQNQELKQELNNLLTKQEETDELLRYLVKSFCNDKYDRILINNSTGTIKFRLTRTENVNIVMGYRQLRLTEITEYLNMYLMEKIDGSYIELMNSSNLTIEILINENEINLI